MRILKLQFTNINSLAGTWQVDFTGPAYKHGGIFAITGPTGAGKSTILDAICLALYGCTPRLKSISMSENEAMTRLTSVCSSEVTFQTQAGAYRCTWSQRRARGKADGNLQQPKHEIVDARTGDVLESQIRKVAEKIVAVTGMDLDQFTRSMLLAQGKFATFLYADANERGPVLEQITGTEIYSKISVYVYDRWTAEKKELDKLAIELNGMSVMTADERAARRTELETFSRRSAELTQQTERLRAMLAWHEHVSKLEAALAEAEDACKLFALRSAEAEPMRIKLARAEQASALEALYAPLIRQRDEAANFRSELGDASAKLPAATRERDDALHRLENGRLQREELRSGLERESVLWKKVRELDTTIREKSKTLGEYRRVRDERRTELERQSAKQKSLSSELETIGGEREALRQFFESNASDASLTESFGAIEVTIDGILANAEKLAQKRSSLSVKRIEHAQLTTEKEAARGECERSGLNARSTSEAAAESDAQLDRILCGRDAAGLRSATAALAAREKILDEALRTLKEMEDARTAVASHVHEKELQTDRQANGRRHALQAEQDKAAARKEVDHCEEVLRLQRTIDDLVEHRAHLEDGLPCPLCGSLDHPYAYGQIPKTDEKAQALARAKAELDAVTARLQKYDTELAKIETEIAHLDAAVAEKTLQIQAYEQSAEAACASLGIQCTLPVVAGEADAVRARKQEAEELARAADTAIAARDRARKDADEAQRRSHASQLRYEQIASRFEKADEALKSLALDCDTASGEMEAMLSALQARCESFGIGTLTVEMLFSVKEQLLQRRNLWEERMRASVIVEKRAQEIAQDMKSVDALHENIGRLLEQAEADALRCSDECEALAVERRMLYGENIPDEEERKKNEAIAAMDASITACAKEAEQSAARCAALEKEISMLRKRLDDAGAKLVEDEKAFSGRLAESGFISEDEFASVRLPADDRVGLQRMVNALRDEEKMLESRREQKRSELLLERARNLTSATEAETESALKDAAARSAEVLQTIGALEDQLRRDEEQQGARAEKASEQERRQREYRRWDDLNELIGSASGKKFQKIAQAVTFEMMVAQANKVLRKMSPRYFLVCDPETELEMKIVDQYQAGEVRSTKNLSGGESFIVSLSLALGLSQMASRNVRVDSLFLDEGFGTLDEEALDIALTTLSELQQEGKTIGVISHVGALKERIGTQIVVTPDSGGRSTLSGPGCRRIN